MSTNITTGAGMDSATNPAIQETISNQPKPAPPTKIYIYVSLDAGASYSGKKVNNLTARLTIPESPQLARYATMKPFAHEALKRYQDNSNGRSHHQFELAEQYGEGWASVEVTEPAEQNLLTTGFADIISYMKERKHRAVGRIAYERGQITTQWHGLYDIEVRTCDPKNAF
ncbi:MAG: hypothetical protein HY051_03765 [Candidatus Aenigmarchaeota archaeon]|nr:hypothetical protein [Candidatus Aenigmarchaeota archaeon]